ncbi:MAG: alanine--tRNA ligase [Candidatus Omnitrophica bacterium]|nr:alanine--tRNA ligase [Candidatus Omnitrophota bacterium]MDD5591824.1 alanine--tRNA ligase [Candidatus Omnitrophota bacterium]
MKADLLREKFPIFFKAKKHKIVESDSLIPKDDPTVLFTPAGMNQFKRQFLGHLTGFSRAASSQRCLRTDDLDKVGKTPSHHTFFEMLGNFSFGDYFKEEAITWAWEFLTEELKIKEDKLWVSVYKDDDESYNIWKDKIKVPVNKIVKLGDKENFWPSEAKANGPNGPCGPCSEIFFDQGAGCGKPGCGPACSCGRFPEIWNLVFTQFNRKADGKLEPLPKKNIDTGMGLERLAAVMQGVPNNFETDLFQPIVKEIVSKCQSVKVSDKEFIYAVSDHIRAIVFAIYDGVLPSNEGRGYVVRKIIRKSMLHLRALGIAKPFLYKLTPLLSDIMKLPYPELDKRKENISQIILAEENNFISTLDSSSVLFEEKFKGFSNKQDAQRAGRLAFQLYDTYGIPLELTRGWLEKAGINFSQEAFDKELGEQKNRSKLQSRMKGDVFDIKELHLAGAKTSFLGYSKYETKAKVIKIIKDNTPVKKISAGEEARIILDKTVLYPESGGQVGDTGELIKGKNVFQITGTRKFDNVIVHKGRVKTGSFRTTDELMSCVDIKRRLSIARNHTATHLLQAALRVILGAHVQQQGSLVAEDRLRFDFTHFKDVTREQLDRIEGLVNNYIVNNTCLKAKTLTLAEAKRQGALAFFTEKYAEKVRMVAIGDFSKELCGGTHLECTGQIGLFKIVNEGSIASGIRRIEALTGDCAYKALKEEENILADISSLLNVPSQKITQELEKKLFQIKELEKKLSYRKTDMLRASIDNYIKEGEIINGINVIARFIEGQDMDALRKAVDLIKAKEKSVIVALGTTTSVGGALLVTGTNLNTQILDIDSAKIIKAIAPEIGGSGGGRKDFAQAGGNKPENFPQAFKKLKEIIRELK